MASKKDVERARVLGMKDILAVYKSCRNHNQDEETALESLEKYIQSMEWQV